MHSELYVLLNWTTSIFIFFFNDTATTEIYTLSLHDALPIWGLCWDPPCRMVVNILQNKRQPRTTQDRKSTRLNSSHLVISYAVFCLKKKIQTIKHKSDRLNITKIFMPMIVIILTMLSLIVS